MKALGALLMFLGRLCIAAIFISSGINKFIQFDQTVAYIASKGLQNPILVLFAGAVFELLGGLSLLLGFKTRWGALLLMAFLTLATYFFHDFWNLTGEERQTQLIMFMKNLAIFGGLLYVLACGSGRCACDSCRRTPIPEDRP